MDLREDTYRGGTAILTNAQHSQPLAALFGAADVSSSDGQHFPTAGHGEAVGAFNAHYGREATALFYTHVSDRHAPFYTAPITGAGEAAHVIDGLLYHEADLSISAHHTDGGGVSDHVSRWRMPRVSASPRASQTWPSVGCMPLAPPAPGRRGRHSSQASPTRRPSRHSGTTCCALRPRSAPAWSARR